MASKNDEINETKEISTKTYKFPHNMEEFKAKSAPKWFIKYPKTDDSHYAYIPTLYSYRTVPYFSSISGHIPHDTIEERPNGKVIYDIAYRNKIDGEYFRDPYHRIVNATLFEASI